MEWPHRKCGEIPVSEFIDIELIFGFVISYPSISLSVSPNASTASSPYGSI